MKVKINADLKEAMKAKDATRVSTLRSLLALITQEEKVAGTELNDSQVQAMVSRAAKQRRQSITEFEKGNRPDLVGKEVSELAIIETYLPKQLSVDEIKDAVANLITAGGHAGNPKAMGAIMKAFNAQYTGLADGKVVSTIIQTALASA